MIIILSLNGSKDTQVNAKINQEGIRKALIKGGNKDYETHPSPTRSAIFNAGKVSRINVCYFMTSLIMDNLERADASNLFKVFF
ncbi:hypothetical protein [uncultured Winogradskyella sp.]|uniref:hypothetical protein n=1 Tax=uncultured Winogradskyella sp. TaxID=395353 RepID=UPI0026365C20|nr:hypothetical protein [uncultured Winogradskyella sp.]